MVRFRDGKPIGIYYSQHVDGKAYGWDDPIISKVDGRVCQASASHYLNARPNLPTTHSVASCLQRSRLSRELPSIRVGLLGP